MKFSNFNFLTSDPVLKMTNDYQIVASVMTDMAKTGNLFLITGHCISSANMIYSALKQKGINSRIVEVETTVCNIEDNGDETFFYIGFDQKHVAPGEIDTHVIVITDTEVPMIIDASINHKLKKQEDIIPVVIDSIKPDVNRILGNYTYYKDESLKILYREKVNQRDAISFQKSVLERIETDRKIFKTMENLRYLNYIGIFLSIFSVINIIMRILEIGVAK